MGHVEKGYHHLAMVVVERETSLYKGVGERVEAGKQRKQRSTVERKRKLAIESVEREQRGWKKL